MPSVNWNRLAWSERHQWEHAGDEWAGMAAHCGQPYEPWKQTLVDEFIGSHVKPDAHVVEIAPGHGRWTGHLLGRVGPSGRVTIVDINQPCLDACRARFNDAPNLATHLTTGSELSVIPDRSVDFVWSFDSFVHMDADVIRGYLGEFARVLRPAACAVIHHAGMRDSSVRFGPLTSRLGRPGRMIQRFIGQGRLRDGGNRSAVSRQAVHRWAAEHGLAVEHKTQAWGVDGQYDVRRFGDWITVLRQPD